ncbi:hypothetical protein [Streptomyces vilmorinianum]|uniref:hypothetical protein n=1 Tax=Streptomyces vilmorinianum TaxID=3051092 RepID=UPI0010FBA4FA|nr:hypothetical protein [Streptomyces vilmorinianum]
MTRTKGLGLSVGLCAAALLCASACGPGEEASKPSRSPGVTGSASPTASARPGADVAKAVLEGAFVGRESLGSGSGQLQRQFGNTHPATPDGVLSVTFAFTCTGGADTKVALRFAVADAYVPSAEDTAVCDGSVFQRSIDVTKSGPFRFEAGLTGSEDGGYAYAYYVEKKQLP